MLLFLLVEVILTIL